MKKIFLAILMIGLLTGITYAEVARYQVPLEGSPYLGPANAPVTIIEFIDYQ